MEKPRIYADFQKVNASGLLILTTQGSIRDLNAIAVLRNDLEVVFYSDDEDREGNPDELEVDGLLKYDSGHNIWLGYYQDCNFRHASENRTSQA